MTRHARIDLTTIARLGDLTKRETQVYIFLLACRNPKTGRCNPSRSTIAAGTGLAPPHVSVAIGGLENKQWIAEDPAGGFEFAFITDSVIIDAGKITNSVIKPNLKITKTVRKNYQNGNGSGDGKITNLARKVTNSVSKITNSVSQRNIDLTTNNSKNKHIVAEAGDGSVADKANKVFEYWKRVCGKSERTTFADKRKKAVIARLKKYSVRDIFDAIEGCRKSPHHSGENDRQTVYDDLELICRSDTHLEKFIEFNERGRAKRPGSDVGRYDPAAAAAWVPPPPCEFCGDPICNKIECGEKRRAAA